VLEAAACRGPIMMTALVQLVGTVMDLRAQGRRHADFRWASSDQKSLSAWSVRTGMTVIFWRRGRGAGRIRVSADCLPRVWPARARGDLIPLVAHLSAPSGK